MSTRLGTSVATPHRESHVALLPPATFDGVNEVDAVVVPTARGAHHLAEAARLAGELGAVLLALCSLDTRSADVAAAIEPVTRVRPGLEWYAVDVHADHTHPLLPPIRRRPDIGGRMSLSRKRNIGLVVGRMVGWRTILFLDDDIRDVQPDLVRLAAGSLGPAAAAVGLAVRDYPDNSVVCHANRAGGGAQTVFVSGSALLVDVTAAEFGHFPTVYNEDWLFLFDALEAGRVRREGSVRQLRYDPFARPRRAREEEFGDVVAEGLVAHLEAGGRGVPLKPSFWTRFLRRREAFLARTTARVAAGEPHPRSVAALLALEEATDRCSEIRPAQIIDFLREWRADRQAWRDQLAGVARVPGVPAALRRLGLRRAHGRAAPDADLAVVVPGFLDGPQSPAHRAMAAALPALGLRVVVASPPGMPDHPGDPFTLGPTDHLAALTETLDEHAVPGGRVVLVGHCYGAWLAGLLAARDERVSHLVAIAPTRCFLWSDDYRKDRDTWRRRGELLLSFPEPGSRTLSAVRLPHALVADALKHDLPAALGVLDVPVLFVAGTDDEVVPAAGIARLHGECGSADKELRTLAVRHDYRDVPEQTAEVTECVRGWLAKRLH